MLNLLNRDRFNVKSTQGSGSGTITILILLLSLAVVFIFATGHASAESPIIYVNDSGGNDSWNGQNATWEAGTLNGPKKSIKNATGTVTENGLINIADGTYAGENNTNITINKNLILLGESQSNTIINGTNTVNLFIIQSGYEVSFCNLTLTNGNMGNSRPIYNYVSNLYVINCTFTDNTIINPGGAIYNDGGNLVIFSSIFTRNKATNGGAIYNGGTTIITDSTFTDNNAATGGAIFTTGSAIITTEGSMVNYSILYILNSTFTQNTAIEGGAICNALYSNVTIFNNTFTNNTADWYGGAISNTCNLTVIDSKFTDNHIINNASIWDMTFIPCGGAIYNKGNLTVVNNTFTNNSAGWYGGAIYSTGNLTVIDSTFTDNCVTLQEGGISNSVFFPSGGAIHNFDGYLIVFNSTFNNNKAFYGGAIYNQNFLTVTGSIFNGNVASGGAIFNDGGTSTTPTVILNSTFINNGKNYHDGGAIVNFENDYMNLNNCTFINNTAPEARGGAIHNQGLLSVTESNFTGNSAGNNGMGGAISNLYGSCYVEDSNFTSNIARLGGAIYNYINSVLTVTGSILTDNTAAYYGSGYGGAIYNLGSIDLYFNSIVGNIANLGSDIYNDGGTFDVTFNWWGSNENPISKTYGIGSCTPWLYMTLTANPATILNGQTSEITANLNNYCDGITVTSFNPDMGHLADGCPVTFTTDLGTLGYKTITINTINGAATATLKANETPGIAHLSAQVNSETEYTNVEIADSSFTISQIMNVAVDVKNYLEATKTLPTLITINGRLINQAQFLQLLCIATLQIKTGNMTPLDQQDVQLPSSSIENLKLGTLTIIDYLELAQNIKAFIENSKVAPGNMAIFQGQIGFQSMIYMYCRVLNQYKINNALPTFITIKPWTNNNIPIKDTTKTTITIQDIYQTAYEVKNFAETTKTLPEYINIAGILVNQAEFLNLLTTTTLKINNTDYTNINLQNTNLPPTNTENLKMGTLNKNDYLILAQNITALIETNQIAPGNMAIFQGQIGFQSMIYMYSRILTQYKINNALPTFITIKPWTNNNIPIKDTSKTTITIQDIYQTAYEVKNFAETTKTLPEYINIAGILVNQAEFLNLLTTTTLKINNTDYTNINLQNTNLPPTNTENLKMGTLNKNDYLQLALNIKTIIENDKIAPGNMAIFQGQIGFQSMIYMYCRVLNQYKLNNALPEFITVRSWTNNNIPIKDTSKTTITIQDIYQTAYEVKNFAETTKTLPEYINIAGILVNQAEFLHLLTMATIKINSTFNTDLNLLNVNIPLQTNENLNMGTLVISDYLVLAQNINAIIENSKIAPGNMTVFQGQIGFQSMIYMYSRILTQYKINNALPTFITIKPWTNNNIPIKDTSKTGLTNQDVIKTAIEVKNFYEGTKNLPEYINVNGVLVNQGQFMQLMAIATIKLNNTDSTNINLQNVTPSNGSSESIIAGNILKQEYLDLALNIKSLIDVTPIAPVNMTCSLGQIGFKSMIYMYTKILESYDITKILPTSVAVRQWA